MKRMTRAKRMASVSGASARVTAKSFAVAAFVVAAIAGASIAPTRVAAQNEAGALAAVEQLFDGMRTADPDMVRAVFAADARFAVLDGRNGPTTIRSQSVDGWIGAIGGSGGTWNEQVYDLDVRVDGDMASIWAPYTFYLDGAISHCGINSIELLRDAEGWKVTQLSDTRRTDDCPDPLGVGQEATASVGEAR